MLYSRPLPHNFDLEAALALLPKWRRDYALRYKAEGARRQSVAAFLLLADALREDWGLKDVPEFVISPGGKPLLPPETGLHISLSHCRTAVACAVGTTPVGVDIETIRHFNRDLAARTLSCAELKETLAAANPAVEFARYWTKKEAIVKLTGEGLRSDIRTILDRQPDDISIETLVERDFVVSCSIRNLVRIRN